MRNMVTYLTAALWWSCTPLWDVCNTTIHGL